ncbi:MAG: prepilin-type N-terminal cleavage/methylation domain-containing protein [Oligoflexia bacterium]|nr:prepilin-type N-terminal cleavage/methylation domain-containing protein [Oligoflexia bacterium]
MLTNQKGFSLIELMIVVAIIGILSAIAIPNYTKFQLKAKQSEAKASLSGVYTAEKSFHAEYSTFTGHFDAIGFAPDGRMNYGIGFAAAGAAPPTGAPAGTNTCFQTATAAGACLAVASCQANFNNWTCTAIVQPPLAANTVDPGANVFQAAASANLLGSGIFDVWTMTQNRVLTNAVSGI